MTTTPPPSPFDWPHPDKAFNEMAHLGEGLRDRSGFHS
jgi:hypothetical protein